MFKALILEEVIRKSNWTTHEETLILAKPLFISRIKTINVEKGKACIGVSPLSQTISIETNEAVPHIIEWNIKLKRSQRAALEWINSFIQVAPS